MSNILTRRLAYIPCLFLFLAISSMSYSVRAEDLNFSLELESEKYFIGSSIVAQLEIHNQGAEILRLAIEYPDALGLSLTSPNVKPPHLFDHRNEGLPQMLDGEMSVVSIKPGEKYTRKISLNRYLKFDRLGDYKINYTINLGILINKPGNITTKDYRSTGEINLSIANDKLQDSIGEWIDVVSNNEASFDQLLQALEILAFSNNDDVPDVLIRHYDRITTQHPNLGRSLLFTLFQNVTNKKVRDFLIQIPITTGNIESVKYTLDFLLSKKISVPKEYIEKALMSNEDWRVLSVLNYLAKTGNSRKAYNAFLRQLIDHENPQISAVAKKMLAN